MNTYAVNVLRSVCAPWAWRFLISRSSPVAPTLLERSAAVESRLASSHIWTWSRRENWTSGRLLLLIQLLWTAEFTAVELSMTRDRLHAPTLLAKPSLQS